MKTLRCTLTLFLLLLPAALLPLSCEFYYGEVGGADDFDTIYTLPDIFPGVWYSRYPYADHYRTDGYRMAAIAELKKDPAMKAKIKADFPDIAFNDNDEPILRVDGGTPFSDSDYYLYYDDFSGGSWGFVYMGVVRAANMFKNALESTTLSYGGGTYSNVSSGAIIIEYFAGAYPKWEPALAETPLPYFGVYYRILAPDIIQMANS
ncbi:MAG: hypothetical protein LBU16_04020, partial [Treponema sp.]|nr:hypothetical protein [Treponema sp.]